MSSLLSSISGSPPAKACFACCSSRTWSKRYHQHVSTMLQSKKPCPCSQSSCCWGFWCLDPHRQRNLSQTKKKTDLAGHALGPPAGRWESISPWDSLCWGGVNSHQAGGNWFHLEMLEWCQFPPAPQWLVPPQEFGCQEVWTLLPTRPHQTCNPARNTNTNTNTNTKTNKKQIEIRSLNYNSTCSGIHWSKICFRSAISRTSMNVLPSRSS